MQESAKTRAAKMNKMNKKAMSIPIVLLVILTLILIVTSLFYFNIKQKDVKETMMIPDEIDKVYIKQVQLNYYLDDIFDRSTKDFELGDGKQAFIENYTKELSRYKVNGNWIMDELGQVESQIVENNVELNETAIILKLSLEILGEKEIDGKEVINIKYNYDRKFEKVFKLENI